MTFKAHFFTAFSALAILAASSPAQTLGAAAPYNVFLIHSGTFSNSDIQGKAAIGGSANFSSYSVASNLGAGTNLVVGGALTFNSGSIYGSGVAGGSVSLNSVGFPIGGSVTAGSPINFAAAGTQLQNTSTQIAGLTSNGSVANSFGTLNLTGSSSSINIFSLSASQLNGISGIQITAPTASSVVINVLGTSAALSGSSYGIFFNGSSSGSSFGNVLWNFSQATSLSLTGWNGSVLAPLAAVTGSYGQVNGQFVADSYNGTTEFHNVAFGGSVPEPASLVGAFLALGGLAARRLRKA